MFLFSQINPLVGIPLVVAFILIATTIMARMRGSTPHRRQASRIDVFTVADVAEMCDVSEQEVRCWIESGLVVSRPSRTVVLVLKKDLSQFLEQTRV